MEKKEILVTIILSLIVIFFSLFSISSGSWVWNIEGDWQKVLGTISGITAFTGVVATIYFYKKKTSAFYWAIINAILFGLYSLSLGLIGDFALNILLFIPVFIIGLVHSSREIPNRSLWKGSSMLMAFIFIIFFLLFFFFIPEIYNSIFSDVYGQNFSHYIPSLWFTSISYSISIVGAILMVRGYRETWFFWIIKDIFSILFFSYFGTVDISIIILNSVYLLMAIYMLWKSMNTKQFHFAIIGPGAVGKTTTIKHLSGFLDKKKILVFSERTVEDKSEFENYMKNLKGNAYKTQVRFFKERLKTTRDLNCSEKGIIDRHITDDLVFPLAHKNFGNFSKKETYKWKLWQSYFIWKNMEFSKLDVCFLLRNTNETIEDRREKRSLKVKFRSEEVNNLKFFREVNSIYNDNESILYKNWHLFSKKLITIENNNSEDTSKKMEKIISEYLQ